MKPRAVALVVALAAVATVARSGHELPVYPSYYPHEIEINRVAPDRAAALLIEGKLHAYIGGAPRMDVAPPEFLRPIESLGAFIVVRINPQSPRARDDAAACALGDAILHDIAKTGGGINIHPYPVTPFHGDYLHHVDRAEAARARLLAGKDADVALDELKVKAESDIAGQLVRPAWRAAADWDAAIETIDVANLAATHGFALGGWLGPRWVRSGWFHAYLLLRSDAASVNADLERLRAADDENAAERINLERDLVAKLASDCRTRVAGYTVKREYINTEFSAGIENIAYDAIAGLSSPMFIRTVKLKDFPWNGWLALGIGAAPEAAWNPIAGFTDPFGRLAWHAVGDPAAIPSPYDGHWILNRIAGVEATPRR